MLSVRKQDPLFVNFVPKNAEEAVDRFIRCKRRGLKSYLIPECLIACAQGLSPDEMEKFEAWIVDPEGNTSGGASMQLVETKEMQQRNQQVFDENVKRVEAKMLECSLDDEKMLEACSQDDEKMQESDQDDEKMKE